MKNKFICFAVALLCLSFNNISAQDLIQKETKEFSDFMSRLYYGSGLYINSEQNRFNFKASPMIGYKITKKFSAGLRLPVNYTRFKNAGYLGDNNNEISLFNLNKVELGLGAFTRYQFSKIFFAHAEYNHSKVKEWTTKHRFNAPPSFFDRTYNKNELNLGIGFKTKGKVSFEGMMLYNLLPTASPLSFRFGVNYNF